MMTEIIYTNSFCIWLSLELIPQNCICVMWVLSKFLSIFPLLSPVGPELASLIWASLKIVYMWYFKADQDWMAQAQMVRSKLVYLLLMFFGYLKWFSRYFRWLSRVFFPFPTPLIASLKKEKWRGCLMPVLRFFLEDYFSDAVHQRKFFEESIRMWFQILWFEAWNHLCHINLNWELMVVTLVTLVSCNSNPSSKSCFDYLLRSVKIKNHPLKFSSKDKNVCQTRLFRSMIAIAVSRQSARLSSEVLFLCFLDLWLRKNSLPLCWCECTRVCVCCYSAFLSEVTATIACYVLLLSRPNVRMFCCSSACVALFSLLCIS